MNRSSRYTFRGVLGTSALICSALLCMGASYHVSPNGNDSQPGTQAAPFATLQKGLGVAQAGDTVVVVGTVPTTSYVSLPRSGSPGLPITIRGYDQSSTLESPTGTIPALVASSARDYITIDNLTFKGTGIEIRGSHLIVQNSRFVDGNNNSSGSHRPIFGIRSGSSSVLVRNVIFSTDPSINNGVAGISVAASSGIVIEDCVVTGGRNAVFLEDSSDIVIRRSVIRDSRNHSLVLATRDGTSGVRNLEFYQNVMYEGPQAWTGDTTEVWMTGLTSNIKVFNNTFYNLRSPTWTGGFPGEADSGWVVINNIFYRDSDWPYGDQAIWQVFSTSPSLMDSRHNLFYELDTQGRLGCPSGYESGSYPQVVASFRAGCGNGAEQNSLGSPPMFVGAPGNLNLQQSSPAVDAGVAPAWYPLPFAGPAPDLGRFEYGVVASVPPAPSNARRTDKR